MLLYLHIPFCDSKCSYCAFNSYVDKFHLKRDYMQAVMTQLVHELQRFEASEGSIESVFIGGGTPSTLSPELFAPFFKALQPYLAHNAEITSEANPNSATASWLQGMYALGVNRISFGVQSFNDTKLRLLNRAHRGDDAKKAVLAARDIGFENLSLDLIYAVKGDTKALLQHDLNEAFSLPINHLSAYALTIEERTPFEQRPEMAHEELELTQWLFDTITSKGFEQYEISNFGTYRSLHNRGYWQYKDYIGIGSGAVGFLKDVRFYPALHVESYIDNPLAATCEHLSAQDRHYEQILLGLRSDVGVDAQSLPQSYRSRMTLLEDEGKLTCNDSRRYFNPEFLLSDELALFITS